MRAQPLVDMVNDGRRFRVIKRLPFRQNIQFFQPVFQKLVALVGVGDVAGFLVQREMFVQNFGDQLVDGDVKL